MIRGGVLMVRGATTPSDSLVVAPFRLPTIVELEKWASNAIVRSPDDV